MASLKEQNKKTAEELDNLLKNNTENENIKKDEIEAMEYERFCLETYNFDFQEKDSSSHGDQHYADEEDDGHKHEWCKRVLLNMRYPNSWKLIKLSFGYRIFTGFILSPSSASLSCCVATCFRIGSIKTFNRFRLSL